MIQIAQSLTSAQNAVMKIKFYPAIGECRPFFSVDFDDGKGKVSHFVTEAQLAQLRDKINDALVSVAHVAIAA